MERDLDDYEERRPRKWLWMLLFLVVMFLAGLVAAGYAVTHDVRVAHFLKLVPMADARADTEMAQRLAVSPAVPPPAPASAATKVDPDTAERLAALESEVGEIESQARAATGNASRAEGLLVAFAARRALDRGVELGYIEGLLRQRFAATQPQAVAMILSASRVPVTLSDLQTGLDAIAPALSSGSGAPRQGWWQSFRQQLGDLVVVRRAGELSSQPADRVARAERMLESGQVDGALAEILRLPDHAIANGWIVAARRYLAGRGALDRIETAALLDPAPDGQHLPTWPDEEASTSAASSSKPASAANSHVQAGPAGETSSASAPAKSR